MNFFFKLNTTFWLTTLIISMSNLSGLAASNQQLDSIPELENPISRAYLQQNLRKELPRLILTDSISTDIQRKLKTDPVLQNMLKALKLNGEIILKKPFLERIQVGRRLLGVSREMLYRINVLGILYQVEKHPAILARIDQEVKAVCQFSDWNPSHFLDVAEMALAVSLALDWTERQLPEATIALAKEALVEKALKPSFNKADYNWWITRSNNWNQVCHGGMIAAAITVAEDYPTLASQTIARALKHIPIALHEYLPDGVYPEGSTYWKYGTSFSVLTISMLQTALGSDFGMATYPAFQESAIFRVLSNAPSGWYYNFADCGDKRSQKGDLILAWFAAYTGNPLFFERERFLMKPEAMGKLSRHIGAGFVWLSQFKEKEGSIAPTAWKGEGGNPVVIFRDPADSLHQYYFGGKGGRGLVNHGNMDAGSFIFELNGVRWSIDPGLQNYHDLEKIGFDLWGKCQQCDRWTLLTKNNFGHSTLSVNNALHRVEGLATISDFQTEPSQEATIDLTPAFGGLLQKAHRRFVKDSDTSLLIEDYIEVSDSTEIITWQMMTTAAVKITDGGALLSQDGRQLALQNLSHPKMKLEIVHLDPPPLEIDRHIEGLKRLEFRYTDFEADQFSIRIKLEGQ